ncbi:hypothetical protein BKA70DRAFT_1429941 [Coprinopsis sp. MPI-PUGE-AT-0042]|nr:hypothetical protein BKA70DRAFT_1429941 [Coprinopsis sp. MPI-PUGE-AT-0042]
MITNEFCSCVVNVDHLSVWVHGSLSALPVCLRLSNPDWTDQNASNTTDPKHPVASPFQVPGSTDGLATGRLLYLQTKPYHLDLELVQLMLTRSSYFVDEGIPPLVASCAACAVLIYDILDGPLA